MFHAAIIFALVLLVASTAWGQAPRTRTVVHDFEEAKGPITLSPELEFADGTGIRLARSKSHDYEPKGTLSFSGQKAPLAFNDVVLSWNVDMPEGTGALVELRALDDEGRSTEWYEMARLGKVPLPLERRKKDDFGHIEDDTLVLDKPWSIVDYRVTLYTNMPHRTPVLRLMAVCYSDVKNRIPVNDPAPKEPQPWMRSLPVRWRSQMVEEPSISWRICGPTSMSMAMEYLGCNLPTADVAAEAWDDWGRLFGNWPFLAQAAARHGFKSWVSRCEDYKTVEAEIAAGRPVVIGVAFKEGELNNGPFPSTDGHLILCVGFTPEGDLICNDPGTRDSHFDHRIYKREEMAKAWLGSGAIAIHIVPRQKR